MQCGWTEGSDIYTEPMSIYMHKVYTKVTLKICWSTPQQHSISMHNQQTTRLRSREHIQNLPSATSERHTLEGSIHCTQYPQQPMAAKPHHPSIRLLLLEPGPRPLGCKEPRPLTEQIATPGLDRTPGSQLPAEDCHQPGSTPWTWLAKELVQTI